MQKSLVIPFLLGALSSCVYESVTEIKPAAAGVKLVREDDKPFRCKVLGDVHGTSRSTDREKARKGAEAELKNNAAALKANYVVVEIDRQGMVGSSSYSDAFMAGKALKCEEQKEEDKG
jgi:uncharacterized protein YbjQ (UPF0145 family)